MAGIPSIFRGSYTDPQLEKGLAMVLKSILGSYQNRVIVLCIGTDANIADSLGPLVGTMLVEAGSLLPIYGTLDQPLHARNLKSRLELIQKDHPGFLELAVDASVGKKEEIGSIEIKNGGVHPGRALRKRLPQVGHISILGKVEIYQSIRSAGQPGMGRLGMVYRMAQVIAGGILRWERELG
ncbi:MAG: spore protease YyaC [Syntrophomonadaceae bacterium]|jgi:putative sporulation protein YyaC|nr:spore protease YyaC [Syntrophomonadaceae bacterium]